VNLSSAGKAFLLAAAVLAVLGGTLLLMGRGVLPRIPGDLLFRRGNVRIFIPLGTCIVLSVVLTVLLSLFARR
jgi:hypothetical protein